jgi:hypothetical protein
LAFLAGAAAMALIAVIAGLWNGKSNRVILNTERVERSIETSILSQRHLASTVSCPVNIVQKAGVVFNCQATVRGREFPVVVTETDSNGHVTYVVT